MLKINQVADTYKAAILIEDEGNPGFMMDFPILICADAIEKAGGSTHFDAFPYSYDGSRLKFGGFQIYCGIAGEDLKPFEDAHIKLRSDCARWKLTKEISEERRALKGLADVVGQQLQKFSAFSRLPGRCELCS